MADAKDAYMQYQISGIHINVGDALQTHVKSETLAGVQSPQIEIIAGLATTEPNKKGVRATNADRQNRRFTMVLLLVRSMVLGATSKCARLRSSGPAGGGGASWTGNRRASATEPISEERAS
mgnify:CR=1 FL=1